MFRRLVRQLNPVAYSSIPMTQPCVSIVIPTYNHDRFVCDAIDSALAQTYPEVEVVVVDDGSTDHTRDRVTQYAGRIIYIYQENKGLSEARNAGVRAAHGELFLFLDADDRIPASKLALQVPLFENRPELGLVYSGFQYVDESGIQVLGVVRPNKQGQVLRDLLRRTFFFPPGAAVVRRECLNQVGLFDPVCSSAADTDLWIRIARAGYAFGYVDEPLFQYRVVKDSMSRDHRKQARHELIRLEKFFSDTELPDDIKKLQPEAYSVLHYEFAAKHFSAGQIELAQGHLQQAIALCPALASDKEWLLEWIAGFALERYPDTAHQIIDSIFDNLPPEANTLRTLRRRAFGRYHVAAAFSEHQNRHLKNVRRHILPALLGDPGIIQNRGFISIAIKSLLA
ncbi:MAG: glycosyltransferase [Chloroflexi bacterium]|nr:glycosyltransferase [Chloroflexota bacterium]